MNTQRQFFITLVLTVVVLMSGCMVGPKYQKPTPKIPSAYRFDQAAADTAYNLRWWELFDDPVLDTLIAEALRQNTDVRIAASRVVQARLAVGYARADAFPRIGYEAGATRGNFLGGQKTDDPVNFFYGAANLQWEIDFWGKYRHATAAARSELLATEYGHQAVQIAIITEVVNVYFQLLDFQERMEITLQTIQTREGSLDIIQQRFDEGVVAGIDLNQAQIQLAVAAGALPQYERAVVQTENALSFLLGRNPGIIITGQPLLQQALPPEIPPGLPSELLQRRPDIAQADEFLQAQYDRAGIAQAQRFPSISITGLLGLASADLSTLASGGAAWSVSGGLLGPIFNFGKNKRRFEIEKERITEVEIQYESTVLQAFGEVENALISINTYGRQYLIKEQELSAALNASMLSNERYDGGVTSYLEVLESERTLFQVQQEMSQLRREYLSGYINLYQALGGGWITPEQ
jgi:multidrug efflux system outer membrane protein